MLDRSSPPDFVPVKDISLTQADSRVLDNGIRLHAISAGSQPVINLQIIFNAGKWYEKVPGSSILLSKLMLEGTKKFSAEEINNYFESHGIFWEIGGGTDHLTIDIYLLSKYLHKISEIITDILSNALLPESEFATVKKRLTHQLKINQEKTSYRAASLFRTNIFGESHPYGYALTPEILNGVNYQDVISFYESQVKNRNFEMLASGDLSEEVLEQLISDFAGLTLTDPLITDKTVKDHPGMSLDSYANLYEERDNNVQTSIRIGRQINKRKDLDTIKLEILNRVLGGYFGSRLMKNLREEKGYTYGVHSNMVFLKHGGYFFINTDVIKEKKDDALSEIYKEIRTLYTEAISEDELALVKNHMVGSFIKSINSPFSLAEHFKTMYFHKLDTNYFNHYVSEINKVSSEELLETAKKYLQIELLEITVG
ncbi:M16 family metallopeptidase [Chondrinema litorale]|uniref:M16 family metallopeptidase n=1 Tax=Chondrinema litorale TaxID=2994555 RepID=UPI002542BDA1|nr:pitrilysin family protein [Chondrinema litorale]UZR92584.1 pitrilysin family protein [Chondrinema litorale]